MNILITGAKGFVGKNLMAELKNQGYQNIYAFEHNTPKILLEEYTTKCDFVFHLAGVNRPEIQEDFMKGNFGFTSELLDLLASKQNKAPVVITSSIQAIYDNPYGISKKAGEELLFEYGKENNVAVYVYRLPNVFGKWSRPNYNSAVATFCHNIANDLPIQVNDPNVDMQLVYIDDVVNNFIHLLKNATNQNLKERQYQEVLPVHHIKLGQIAKLIYSFKESREKLHIPDLADGFTKKLYSTYLSFLPDDKFSYLLKMNEDHRGSFTEFIKTAERGQVSINISKPGIVKGQHWHHTKNEKFLVVSGRGVIRFRKIDDNKIIEYLVSSEKLEVVDIPVGYTHNIENLGEGDMVTVMWVNEIFDKNRPDTYFLEV